MLDCVVFGRVSRLQHDARGWLRNRYEYQRQQLRHLQFGLQLPQCHELVRERRLRAWRVQRGVRQLRQHGAQRLRNEYSGRRLELRSLQQQLRHDDGQRQRELLSRNVPAWNVFGGVFQYGWQRAEWVRVSIHRPGSSG